MADAVLGLSSLAKEIQPYIGLKHKLWQDLPQGSGEQVWRRTATESWGCQARCRGLETINTVLGANSLDLCDAGHNARLVQRSRWQKIDTAKSTTTKVDNKKSTPQNRPQPNPPMDFRCFMFRDGRVGLRPRLSIYRSTLEHYSYSMSILPLATPTSGRDRRPPP